MLRILRLRNLMLAAATAMVLGSATLPVVARVDDSVADGHGITIVRGVEGHVGGGAFPGRGFGSDFAGFGLGGTNPDLTDGGFPRDHLHHYGYADAPLGYYDGFSYGDGCSLLDREFRHRPDFCE
jgi:hypothetical protein